MSDSPEARGANPPPPDLSEAEAKLWDQDVELLEAEVEKLLSTMSKALRAFTMYQANNPVFQRFRANLREAYEAIWAEVPDLTLGVTEEGFQFGSRTFRLGKGRDNLGFVLYRDGVRSLTFMPGFEDEVGDFLDALTPALRSDNEATDTLAILWEKDFSSLKYGYVDHFTDGVAIPEGATPTQQPAVQGGFVTAEDLVEDQKAPDPRQVQREDFQETLYFLDPSEMATLRTEVQVEMERDLHADVLKALFDRLEEPRPRRQREILDILDQLLPMFLSHGQVGYAARLLNELDAIQRSKDVLEGELQERVDGLFDRLSELEVLSQFVQSLESGAISAGAEELDAFFGRLRAQALPILFRFAATTEFDQVKERLATAIDALAGRYPSAVNDLLRSDEPPIAGGAARVAGRLGLAQAVPGLEVALKHADGKVRLAAVQALVAIRSTPALQALMPVLRDDDREVRIATAEGLGSVRFASARSAVEAVIDSKQLKEADLTEKMAFFEAYGALGGQGAVQRLDDLLNSKGFLGRRNPTEIRACAALGLGNAGTPEARKALEKAMGDDDSVVRNAVIRAMRKDRAER